MKSGPGSSVGIATDYGLDGSWIESRWKREFPPVQTGPGTHPTSCTMGTGSFPEVKCGRGVLLTTQPLLAPSWNSSAIALLPLGHNRACNGVILPFNSMKKTSAWEVNRSDTPHTHYSLWNPTLHYRVQKKRVVGFYTWTTEVQATSFHPITLTLILLMWWIWWAPNNSSKWQMGFNSAFQGLKSVVILFPHLYPGLPHEPPFNPFRSYIGPRTTVWFSSSAPMSEEVRHGFCCVCSPAVGACPTLFLV
jgi:hypothetical protein